MPTQLPRQDVCRFLDVPNATLRWAFTRTKNRGDIKLETSRANNGRVQEQGAPPTRAADTSGCDSESAPWSVDTCFQHTLQVSGRVGKVRVTLGRRAQRARRAACVAAEGAERLHAMASPRLLHKIHVHHVAGSPAGGLKAGTESRARRADAVIL